MNAPSRVCTDDRVVLGRRGAIGAAEWQDLMDHLEGCSDCKVAWLAIQSFEGTEGTQPEDERVVRRAVHAALATRRAPMRFVLRPALAVGALAMSIAAVASAGIAIHRRLTTPPAVTRPADPPAPSVQGTRHRRADQPPVELAPIEPGLGPEPAEVRAPESSRAGQLGGGPRESRGARLFAQALAARGAGRTQQALALFRRLQREAPDTEEATVSLVSAGELLVEAGAFRAALADFEAYLRRAPDGPLAPEALASKSRLLDQLGRSAEATRARRDLERTLPEWPRLP